MSDLTITRWTAILGSIVIDARLRVTTVNADGAEMTTDRVFAEVIEPERLVSPAAASPSRSCRAAARA